MINIVCGVKSTGRICTDLADELTNQGHKVKIAYGRENVPEKYQKYAVRIGNYLDVNIHAVLSRISDSAGFHSTWYTKQFIKWVKRYDPDVIHLHNIHGYYINVEILFNYLRTCGKRIIWTIHDVWPFSGHSALCDANDCTKWQRGCGNCPQLSVYPKSFIDRSRQNWKKKCKLFTQIPNLTIITPSHWMETNIKKSYLRDYPIKVINNGIDLDVFHKTDGGGFRNKYGLKNKFIILGVATVWSYKKGYDDFIKLSTMLDDKYKVVLVGVEDELRTDAYENLLTLGMTNGIEEIVDIYSSANVFVNLTYCDTFPTVNLEARACGLPVITYDTGGSPEAAGEGATVIQKGDIRKIEASIKAYKGKLGKDASHKENKQLLGARNSVDYYIQVISDYKNREIREN